MGNSLVLSCGSGGERELEGTEDRLRQRGKQQKKEVAESKTGEEE